MLDEITSALDPELVGEVLDLLRDLRSEGMTMLICTHEMAFAREIADQVCFLHHGGLLESGPPADVLDNPASPAPRSSSAASGTRWRTPRPSQPTTPLRAPPADAGAPRL
ncbi:hypothetical protein ACIBG5_24955 [Kribbella sp. NPDC050241]|uniref:hypothetical protein n=1 Tax=Kribbella sp. NPDC050241 TaxID=3364115 RepID=UPI0037B2484D